MSAKTHHIIPGPEVGTWKVYKSGASRASRIFNRKEDAITWARKLSDKHGSELFIHRKDGTVERKDFYGCDPTPPKDRKTLNE